MAIQFSVGSRLLLRAIVSLGFLAGLGGENLYSQASASEPLIVRSGAAPRMVLAGPTCKRHTLRFNYSKHSLTAQLEIGLPDEFGVAFEDDDSIEMFRFDIEQRTFGIDREMIGLGFASKTARNIRPSISPPLLV